jgi:hypothetical protein
MQANEVMLIGALALFAAFAMGWCMHWLWTQLLRGSLPSIEAMTNVTQELLNATAQRDAAREEAALKEAELTNLLAQARAERDAAMEGCPGRVRWSCYQRLKACSSLSFASTQFAPDAVISFFQKGARDLR